MPEIKFDAVWLKANGNVYAGDNIRFLDAGEQDKDKNWVFLVGVIPQGDKEIAVQKKFQLNRTNFKKVSKIYGTNSDKWVGKEMKIKFVEVTNPRTGEEQEGIRLIDPANLTGDTSGDPDDEPNPFDEG